MHFGKMPIMVQNATPIDKHFVLIATLGMCFMFS